MLPKRWLAAIADSIFASKMPQTMPINSVYSFIAIYQFIAIVACLFTVESAISYASTNAALKAAYG